MELDIGTEVAKQAGSFTKTVPSGLTGVGGSMHYMNTISLGLLQVTRYCREGKRPNGVGTTIQLPSSLGLP